MLGVDLTKLWTGSTSTGLGSAKFGPERRGQLLVRGRRTAMAAERCRRPNSSARYARLCDQFLRAARAVVRPFLVRPGIGGLTPALDMAFISSPLFLSARSLSAPSCAVFSAVSRAVEPAEHVRDWHNTCPPKSTANNNNNTGVTINVLDTCWPATP